MKRREVGEDRIFHLFCFVKTSGLFSSGQYFFCSEIKEGMEKTQKKIFK